MDAEKMEASHSKEFLLAMREVYKENAGITDPYVAGVFDFLYEYQTLQPKALFG